MSVCLSTGGGVSPQSSRGGGGGSGPAGRGGGQVQPGGGQVQLAGGGSVSGGGGGQHLAPSCGRYASCVHAGGLSCFIRSFHNSQELDHIGFHNSQELDHIGLLIKILL